jgi:hypothetical protein
MAAQGFHLHLTITQAPWVALNHALTGLFHPQGHPSGGLLQGMLGQALQFNRGQTRQHYLQVEAIEQRP